MPKDDRDDYYEDNQDDSDIDDQVDGVPDGWDYTNPMTGAYNYFKEFF